MRPTDLCLAFEHEYLPRYPYMRTFTVDCVIRDIAHHRCALITQEIFPRLTTFLSRYLKEHPDRFRYTGMLEFRVIANTAYIEKKERENRRLRQSPN